MLSFDELLGHVPRRFLFVALKLNVIGTLVARFISQSLVAKDSHESFLFFPGLVCVFH